MGAACATIYANLVMLDWEEANLFTSAYNKYIKYYSQYLDDIYILWDGGIEVLTNFWIF